VAHLELIDFDIPLRMCGLNGRDSPHSVNNISISGLNSASTPVNQPHYKYKCGDILTICVSPVRLAGNFDRPGFMQGRGMLDQWNPLKPLGRLHLPEGRS